MIIASPTRADIKELRKLWQEAFGDTEEFLDAFEKTAFSTDRARCIVHNGEVVCALYWFDCSCNGQRIAYLYAIATAKKLRGQGLCSALMKNTHEHLRASCYDGAILVPGSSDLFRFYERLGYKTCSFVKNFNCTAASHPTAIRKIGVDEYKALRRKALPENAVIQECENLEFLQTMAELYAGDSFLIAARKSKNVLHVSELLGDESIAPMITKALDCHEGVFRTVGNETPFAMYFPLSEKGSVAPSYFVLAFD